jgi:hypothetical protein
VHTWASITEVGPGWYAQWRRPCASKQRRKLICSAQLVTISAGLSAPILVTGCAKKIDFRMTLARKAGDQEALKAYTQRLAGGGGEGRPALGRATHG